MQCNAMQCNAMQCNAMQCNARQGNAMQCNAMYCTALSSICLALQCSYVIIFIKISEITPKLHRAFGDNCVKWADLTWALLCNKWAIAVSLVSGA